MSIEAQVDKAINRAKIEELEEIKEEIEEKQSKYTDRWIMSVTDYSYGCYKAYEETIKLIDNRIAELKGEN